MNDERMPINLYTLDFGEHENEPTVEELKKQNSDFSEQISEKDKRIQELEDENRQLKLQISALKKELERIQNSN